MKIATRPFDPAEYLDTDESLAAYLSEAFASGDPAFAADALGVAARALGMTRIAKEAGLSRESLYRALSPSGNPELATVMRVIGALQLKLTAAPKFVSSRAKGAPASPTRRSSRA